MSLFLAKGSAGKDPIFAPCPDNVDDLKVILTSAEAALDSTRGFCLMTAPVVRSSVAMSWVTVAGVSRE